MDHPEKKKSPTLDQSTLHTKYPDVQLMKRHLESKLELQTRFKNDFDSLSFFLQELCSHVAWLLEFGLSRIPWDSLWWNKETFTKL